jgi:hypothetical protein
MSKEEIGKENQPKKRCQSLITFPTRDLSHQIGNTMHGKIAKLNP